MKELNAEQVSLVSGASEEEGGAVDAAKNVCQDNNLPSDTKVTISMGVGGSIGIGSTGTTTATTVVIETTCGDLLEQNAV